VERALEKRLPGSVWRCQTRPLFYGRRMADLAERHAREVKPSAVVVNLGATPFARDVPIARIRRRWPRLYPYARSAAERLKGLAGGGRVGGPGGWPYRLPRWLVEVLIGAEPEVQVEEAMACTTEALDALVRSEETAVVCGFGFMPFPVEGKQAATFRARADLFRSTVQRYCAERHVASYDRLEELTRAGRQSGRSFDADYADQQTREFEAMLIADRIARSLTTE
jgi:hypothetical protein